MRQALDRESVDLLRHQLEVEQRAGAALQRNDVFAALGVVGLALGIGYGVGAFRTPAWAKGKKRGR
jgi:hypothetical protein